MIIQGERFLIEEWAAGQWHWNHEDYHGRVISESEGMFASQQEAIQDAERYLIEKMDREEQEQADRLESEIYGTHEDQARAFYNSTRL